MSAFSNYLEEKIVQFFLQENVANVSTPGQLYLALFTNASPGGWTDATTFTEPVWSAYARKAIDFTNIASGATKNNGAISFNANDGANPVTINGVGVYDALTSGNLLLWAALTTPKELANGDTISFAENAIVFTLN